ncbi:hypothetical protein L798_02391 [Zootermopsis nevadensis]|uniref:Transcription factor SOX-15 n=2 Tax=Zootermopsis nevadensis TaxID=136037 RepID=A0A067RRA4_ZOONE|nr:hypothetical protein L798_02391 [Zootermopsis nevadensis]
MQEHPNYKYRPRRRKHNKRGGPSPSGVPATSSGPGANGNGGTSGTVGASGNRRANPAISQHQLHQSHQLHQQKLQSQTHQLTYQSYQHPHNIGGYSPLLQQHQPYQQLYSKNNSANAIYGSPYTPIMHTPEASPTGSPEPDSLRLGLGNRVSNASSPLLQQPHASSHQQEDQQQSDTTESQAQQLPTTPQPHTSGQSSSASGLIEDVNAAALPTPEMSPMDQDKDNFQFSGGTSSNNDDKRSIVSGVSGNVLVVGTSSNPLNNNVPTGGNAHHQQTSNNVNLSTTTTTTASIGYHHPLSQNISYHRQPSSSSVLSSNYGGTSNLLHHHHHHHHHHHQTQQNALTATMGLSNGMMMMCTNQRLLESYEHSGLVTGTFYPPVATSQDNQQLGVGSNGGSSSGGHQMYTTANSNATSSLGSSYLGSSGGGSGNNVYGGNSGGNGSGSSGSTSGQGLPTSPSGSHYSCNSPVGAAHSLRTTADGYTGGVIMTDDQHGRNYHHVVVTSHSPHSHHVSYVNQSEEEELILDDATDGGVDTNEFDKYLKYSGGQHPASHEGNPNSETVSAMQMDSNHNYHHHHHQHSLSPNNQHPIQQHHTFYNHAAMESVILSNGGHMLKTEPPGLHMHHQQGIPPYGAAEVQQVQPCDYPDQQQQQIQQIKTEDDFSVILADVRKTCYSS